MDRIVELREGIQRSQLPRGGEAPLASVLGGQSVDLAFQEGDQDLDRAIRRQEVFDRFLPADPLALNHRCQGA
ncbi:MAG: hypothetical protein HYY24_04610 [Verrucomicrobia bacterium]|nr:hypothetical protein [Verrucomicrobiota bacterium]